MTDPIEESRIFADCYPALRRFAAVVGPDKCDPDDLLGGHVEPPADLLLSTIMEVIGR